MRALTSKCKVTKILGKEYLLNEQTRKILTPLFTKNVQFWLFGWGRGGGGGGGGVWVAFQYSD